MPLGLYPEYSYISILAWFVIRPALVEYFKTCEAFIPESRRVEYARQKNHMLVESFLHFIQTMWSGKRYGLPLSNK